MKKLFSVAAVLVLMGGLSQLASANTIDFIACSTLAGSCIKITDGGAGDSNPAPGVITWIGSLGAFTIQVDTSTGNPPLSGGALTDLNYVVTSLPGSGADLLTLILESTGNTPGGTGNFFAQFGGTFSGAINDVQTQAAADSSPCVLNLPSPGVASCFASIILNPNPLDFTSSPMSGTQSGSGVVPSPYGTVEAIRITTTGGASSSSGDYELSRVPEPASMALIGTGFLGLAGILRRRFKK